MPDHFEGARPILSSTANPVMDTTQIIQAEPQIVAADVQALAQVLPPVQMQPEVQVLAPAPIPAKPVARSNDIIKIAGLGSMVQDVRDQISGLRVELPQLAESARALRSTAGNLRGQIDATHDDLKFEAETLGNGSGS